jgi:hypothetical protein
MRNEGRSEQAIKIIQDNLYQCVMQWLSWDFTYQSSSLSRKVLLKTGNVILLCMKALGSELEIKALAKLLKVFAFISNHHQKSLSLKEMSKFPAFLPEYSHYGFQIHGEGHTHIPLQEEPNISAKQPSTYINFGTWRDQIVPRKDVKYRRRGVLRAMFILDLVDLVNNSEDGQTPNRTFDYFVEDIVHWGDVKDAMSAKNNVQPKM